MQYILDLIYLLLFILLIPKILYRRFTQNRYTDGWNNRFGCVDRKDKSKKSIWIHAVSVGEVNATRTIIKALQEELSNYEIVLSTTTDTGYARALSLYGDNISVFYFPMDFSFVMKRAFKRLNPAICLLMELEVWPNFSHTANKLDIPVVVVNGRLSERSYPRYKSIKPVTKWMFGKVSLFLSQAEEYSQRFRSLGVESGKIINTGTLKYDTAELSDNVAGKDLIAGKIGLDNERLWVAGGTGPDEEKIVLDVFQNLKKKTELADVRLAIIPRKPERFDEVAKLIEERGFDLARFSKLKECDQPVKISKEAVILGDTMGDLRKFYALSTCVFVGRSLCPMGGSDMMESTAMARFTTFGPYTFNFKETVNALLENNGAVEIANKEQLYEETLRAFLDNDYAKNIAKNGQAVIKNNQGATAKTISEIKKLIS